MRRGSLFWGSILILLGIVLLIDQFLPRFNAWDVFWPLVLIMLGVWFLFGRSLASGATIRSSAAGGTGTDLAVEQISVPLDDIREARIHIHYGAGRLEVNSSGALGTLLTGSCAGGVEQHLERSGSKARLDLRTHGDAFFAWPFSEVQGGLRWDLGLTREIPLQLEFETGACDTHVLLQDLLVSELSLKTGASSTSITLPSGAGHTRVNVQSGAASVDLTVPQGVAARIQVQSGLAGINIDQNRFPACAGGYESLDYENAPHKVDIHIETGVGSVAVR